jgi:tRNA(Ile)-lysidine synthase TilS/MesJ
MERIQKIVGALRRAVQDYDMIHAGDRIAVGISGGKDSLTMLEALWMLREHIGPDFGLVALALDPRFGDTDSNYSAVEEPCRNWGGPLDIRRTNIGTLSSRRVKNINPIRLCARMRRAMLHDDAKVDGCNKAPPSATIFEDAAETF